MRVIITGVTSFLGINTALKLLSDGMDVVGIVRPHSKNLKQLEESGVMGHPHFTLVNTDFSDLPNPDELGYKTIYNKVKQPDTEFAAWIHFAWDGIGSEGRSDEKLQNKNLLNAEKAYYMAYNLGVKKFLFAGSQAEYGSGDKTNPKPVSAYGKAKMQFGHWVEEQTLYNRILGEREMQFLHLRIYSVYGAGDHETSLVNTMIKRCTEASSIDLGACTQLWNYMEISDFTQAVETLIHSDKTESGIYDIAGSETKPLKDYVEAINEICGGQGILNFGVRGDNAEGAYDMAPDTRLLQDLGFTAKVSFTDGIKKMIPQNNLKKKTSCILCKGEIKELARFSDMPASAQDIPDKNEVKNDRPVTLRLCQCRRCGLVQFDTEPVAYYKDVIRAGGGTTTMTKLRHEEYNRLLRYMNADAKDEKAGNIADKKQKSQQTMQQTVQQTAKPTDKIVNKSRNGTSERSIIEIGCGRGEFMEMWKSLGGDIEHNINISGIEHSAELVKIGKKAKLDISEGFAEKGAKFKGAPFDAFVQFNFLEHQPDPRGMILAIRDNLKDGGFGLVTVPGLEYILKHDGYYELIRDHIAYYSEATLRYLFESCGFKVLSEKTVNRDTIEVIVQKTSDAKISDFEKVKPPKVEEVDVSALTQNYETLKTDINSHIERLKKTGKTIAMWGAGHQGFTLASTTELGGKIAYIIDSAKFKQGRYAPASHIKIVAPEHYHKEPVDEILICAPGYTDEIADIIKRDFGASVMVRVLKTEKITSYRKK